MLEVDVLKLMESKICEVDSFKIRMSMKPDFTLSQDVRSINMFLFEKMKMQT